VFLLGDTEVDVWVSTGMANTNCDLASSIDVAEEMDFFGPWEVFTAAGSIV